MKKPAPKLYINNLQAAAFLRVSRPTIIAWLKKGKLKGRKIGTGYRGSWKIDFDSVKKALR